MSPPKEVPVPTRVTTTGTTLENVDVINHLLFHKAILSEDASGQRINEYLQMVREGEHVSMKDPFDRSVALLFDLVVQARLNPWDIDLVRFSTLYLEHAREEKIDLITAGRLILLAWTVLKLQSDDLVRRTELRKEEAENLSWEEIPDWGLSSEALDYTQRVRMSPRAPLDEKMWHEGDRKVTLMELVDAFEHAREDSELRQRLNAERDEFRARMKAEGREHLSSGLHREDPEADLEIVWQRILGKNGASIRLQELYDATDRWDFVTTFNSVLFLHQDQRITLWQENFPYGNIFVQNRSVAASAGTVEVQPEAPQ